MIKVKHSKFKSYVSLPSPMRDDEIVVEPSLFKYAHELALLLRSASNLAMNLDANGIDHDLYEANSLLSRHALSNKRVLKETIYATKRLIRSTQAQVTEEHFY